MTTICNPAEAISVETTRFGTLRVEDAGFLTFPEGLPGFANRRRFVLVPHGEGTPFAWLQSAEQPNLAFLLMLPDAAFPDYAPPLPPDACSDAEVWVIVTVPAGDPRGMTANLLGPVILEPGAGRGRQIVLDGDRYTTRHPVFPPDAPAVGG
jgi:flagellar assembly factor FliW